MFGKKLKENELREYMVAEDGTLYAKMPTNGSEVEAEVHRALATALECMAEQLRLNMRAKERKRRQTADEIALSALDGP